LRDRSETGIVAGATDINLSSRCRGNSEFSVNQATMTAWLIELFPHTNNPETVKGGRGTSSQGEYPALRHTIEEKPD
jgi:hypothetical protein